MRIEKPNSKRLAGLCRFLQNNAGICWVGMQKYAKKWNAPDKAGKMRV